MAFGVKAGVFGFFGYGHGTTRLYHHKLFLLYLAGKTHTQMDRKVQQGLVLNRSQNREPHKLTIADMLMLMLETCRVHRLGFKDYLVKVTYRLLLLHVDCHSHGLPLWYCFPYESDPQMTIFRRTQDLIELDQGHLCLP